jgi:NitT/TauT family transport system permease protein
VTASAIRDGQRRRAWLAELADASLTRPQIVAGRVVVVALLVVIWAIVASSSLAGAGTIPSPPDVVSAAWGLLGDGALHHALGQTLQAWIVGVVLTLALGVPLGVLLGRSRFAFASTRALFDLLRAVPPVALIPLALLILGVSMRLKIVLIVEVCIWPVLLQTMYGVRAVEPQLLDVARSTRLRRSQTIRWVLIPSALPYIATALRLTTVLALLVAIGVELLGGVPGLGLEIFTAQTANAIPDVYALVCFVAALGILISHVFSRIERRALRWHVSQRDG